MDPTSDPRSTRRTIGAVAAVVGMAMLTALAAYWLLDADRLPAALQLRTADADAQALAAVASAFRAGFDLFAVVVMATSLAQRLWRMLGWTSLMTAVFIAGGDAIIWWAAIDTPTPADLAPHLVLAGPLLVAAAALIPNAQGSSTDASRAAGHHQDQ